MWKLFLDDLRAPPDGTWVVARSVAAAQAYIREYGLPHTVSLDHDLGDQHDAPALLHWLIHEHLDGAIDCKNIVSVDVHSANPVGRENLLGLWASFTRNCM